MKSKHIGEFHLHYDKSMPAIVKVAKPIENASPVEVEYHSIAEVAMVLFRIHSLDTHPN